MFTSPRSLNPADLYQWATELVRELRKYQQKLDSADFGTGEVSPGIGANLVPSGSIVEWAGLSEPEGWAFCDGRELAKDGFPELFSAIGDRWSLPETPSDLFRLPDLRDKFSYWKTGWEVAGGLTGGAAEYSLTEANLPEVSGAGLLSSHTHEYYGGSPQETAVSPGVGGETFLLESFTAQVTEPASGTIDISFGSADPTPIPTIPPFYALPRIIKL